MDVTPRLTPTQARREIRSRCDANDFLGAFLALDSSGLGPAGHPGPWDYLLRRLTEGGAVEVAALARRKLWDAGTLFGQPALDEARFALEARKDGRALEVLDAAFGRETDVAEANLLYGQLLVEAEPDAALRHLERFTPTSANELLAVIDCLRRGDRLQEALERLEDAAQRYPSDPRFAVRRARILERKSDLAGAIAEWDRIIRLAPGQAVQGHAKIAALRSRLEDDRSASQSVADLLVALSSTAGTPDLLQEIEALLLARQSEAVLDLIARLAHPDQRDAVPDRDWASLAQFLLDNGRIGLVGWLWRRGVPVGERAEGVLALAPLHPETRSSFGGSIGSADALRSPDCLLPALSARRVRPRALPHPDDRILLVNATLAAGGAERQFVLLVKSLLAHGVSAGQLSVALFSTSKERGHDHFLADLRDCGIAIHLLPDGGAASADLPQTDLIAALPVQLRSDVLRLAPLVRDLGPGVLHGWQDRASLAAGIVGQILPVPRVVMSARNMRPELRRDQRLQDSHALFRQLALTEGTVLTVNSEAGARDYDSWLDLPSGTSLAIRNGVDMAAFPPLPRHPRAIVGKASARPVEVLGVFRLAANKRPILWLETVAELRRRLPFPIRPRIVGSGPFLARILAAKDGLGLPDLIVEKNLTCMQEIYASAGLLVLLSRVEGTPNVVIEAQACGLPVAACNVGGVAEALCHTGAAAGLLLEAEISAGEAAERIADWLPGALAADPRQRRAFVSGVYGMDVLAKRTLDAYWAPAGGNSGTGSDAAR